MKKGIIKKILGTFAAVAMAVGVASASSVSVKADDLSITINNAQPHATYHLYKLFDATVTTDRAGKSDAGETSEVMDDGISYTLPAGKSLDTTITYDTNQTVTGNEYFNKDAAGNITAKPDIDLNTTKFQEWAKGFGTEIGDKTNNSGSVSTIVFDGLSSGYYFVTSTTGSLVTVTSIAPNAIIKDKNTAPDVNKTENVKTSGIGDDVTYTVEVSLPTGSKNVVFHDRLHDGLTLKGTIKNDTDLTAENSPLSVKVGNQNLTKDTDYTVDYWNSEKSTAAGKTNGDNVTISFTDNYLNGLNAQTTATLVYKVTVNSKAVINMSNEAYVSYGNDPSQESTHKTVYESALGFVINKVDQSGKGLTGAKFALTTNGSLGNSIDETYVTDHSSSFLAFDSGNFDPSGSTKVFDAGSVTFKGLNDNNTDPITYYLYEVKAPDGYNKLTGPIEIQMVPRFRNDDASEHESYVIGYTLRYKMPGTSDFVETHTDDTDITIPAHSLNIENEQGSLLPSTGGIGTTIFYIAGGILIVAAVLLIARRKKSNA
ncbi:MAG: SpaH/EbpB family LPXTG-anchored major pilin [Erysipelotrichaceae bacterium]|nr:SpaH/EbpB family LPXTG-anchored major pilin [Erysipelotrichaceae bacterium]